MNKAEEILKKIGLTSQESRVYLILLELQEAQTGIICKETNIASSNIYKVLENLMKKGLVNYRVQNNTKIFMPAQPETLNELFLEKQAKIDEERKEIAELISSLKKKELVKNPYSNYKYYEGVPAIKSMWHEINNSLTKDTTEKIYGVKKGSYELLLGFYNEHHRLRTSKKAKAQILLSKEDIERAKQRKNNLTEVRFSDLDNEAEWGVVNDYVYLQHITTKIPRAFLIKDPIFAKTFEQVFDELWKQAKK